MWSRSRQNHEEAWEEYFAARAACFARICSAYEFRTFRASSLATYLPLLRIAWCVDIGDEYFPPPLLNPDDDPNPLDAEGEEEVEVGVGEVVVEGEPPNPLEEEEDWGLPVD